MKASKLIIYILACSIFLVACKSREKIDKEEISVGPKTTITTNPTMTPTPTEEPREDYVEGVE